MKGFKVFMVIAITVIGFSLTGCIKTIVMTTTPFEIDSANKAVISFERKSGLAATWGVFCIGANRVPSPPDGVAYNPLEIPADRENVIKIRVYHNSYGLNANPNFNIDREIDFNCPPLSAGSYTISYAFSQIGGGNKRLVLKNSDGKIIQEQSF